MLNLDGAAYKEKVLSFAADIFRHAVLTEAGAVEEGEPAPGFQASDDDVSDSDAQQEPPGPPQSGPAREEASAGANNAPRRKGPTFKHGPGVSKRTAQRLSAMAYAQAMHHVAGAKSKDRLVYDMRKLNARLRKWPFRYTSHARIFAHIKKGSWIASADIKSGFHHIFINLNNQCYFGIRWEGEDWARTRMPFGLGPAPAIFSSLSGEMVETLARRTPLVIRLAKLGPGASLYYDVFMDDLFKVGDTKEACEAGWQDMQSYCSRIGVLLAAEKMRSPSQIAPVLGLEVDTIRMIVRLPEDKRFSMATMVAVAIHAVEEGLSLDRALWRKLGGKLGHATEVIFAGRSRLRAVWDMPYAEADSEPDVLPDLRWWLEALCSRAQASERLLAVPALDPLGSSLAVYGDATGQHACGMLFGPVMLWHPWDDDTQAANKAKPGSLIRLQELYVFLAFARRAVRPGWFKGLRVRFHTDSQVNFWAITNRRSDNAAANEVISEIWDIFEQTETTLLPFWVPRELNVAADAMSNAKTPEGALECAAKYIPRI